MSLPPDATLGHEARSQIPRNVSPFNHHFNRAFSSQMFNWPAVLSNFLSLSRICEDQKLSPRLPRKTREGTGRHSHPSMSSFPPMCRCLISAFHIFSPFFFHESSLSFSFLHLPLDSVVSQFDSTHLSWEGLQAPSSGSTSQAIRWLLVTSIVDPLRGQINWSLCLEEQLVIS